MVPKREKAEKLSTNALENLVFHYLKKQNRPYSLTEISANLQVPKDDYKLGTAQKILAKLHEAKRIEGRVSGKQSIYHAIQTPEGAATPQTLAQLDRQIQIVTDELISLTNEIKVLRSTLSRFESSLSTASLRAQLVELTCEKAEIESCLQSLTSGNMKSVSKQEKESVDQGLHALNRAVNRRRAIVRDMWSSISESWQGETVELKTLKDEFDLEM